MDTVHEHYRTRSSVSFILSVRFFGLLCGVTLSSGLWIYYSKFDRSTLMVEELDVPIIRRDYQLKTPPPGPKRFRPAWTKQFQEELQRDLRKNRIREIGSSKSDLTKDTSTSTTKKSNRSEEDVRQTGTKGKPIYQHTTTVASNHIRKVEQAGHRKYTKAGRGHPAIVCMIFTTPQTWTQRGLAVRLTWARRCDYPLFFYSKEYGIIPEEEGKGIPVVPLPIAEGRGHLTAKSMLGFEWAYRNYARHADWYLKCDDDSYFIMENLQDFLAIHDPAKPHYIGRHINNILKNGYNSGGAGYVLSRKATELLVEQGYKHSNVCMSDGVLEDVDLGRCLEHFGVYPMDTMDQNSKLTFHSDNPQTIIEGTRTDLVQNYYFNKEEAKVGNHKADHILSPFGISFHYVSPAQMYMYDYLLYDVRLGRSKRREKTVGKGR